MYHGKAVQISLPQETRRLPYLLLRPLSRADAEHRKVPETSAN